MDALARQTSGVNFSFNAFLPILALISPTLQGSACPVGEANFNASEKGQTWPYYFADHFAPVRETPQDITTPPLLPLPPLHSPSLRHIDPIPRCTGLPYPQVFEFETRARFSIEGWKFRTVMVRVAPSGNGEMAALTHCCWNSSCFGVRFSRVRRERHSIGNIWEWFLFENYGKFLKTFYDIIKRF